MWNAGWLWSQCRGIGLHVELIWGTPSYFAFLLWHQCSSRLMAVFLGTLWSSIKQIKAPYMFDWEHGIALPALQGNRASSRSEGEVSRISSSCSGNLGYILELRWGWPFKTRVCQRCQDSCLLMRDTSGIHISLAVYINWWSSKSVNPNFISTDHSFHIYFQPTMF